MFAGLPWIQFVNVFGVVLELRRNFVEKFNGVNTKLVDKKYKRFVVVALDQINIFNDFYGFLKHGARKKQRKLFYCFVEKHGKLKNSFMRWLT